jgi:hypothetical protein
MKWKVGELDRQTVIVFQFLDTPGDEIAPGSDEIGKNFDNEWFRHISSLRRVQGSMFKVQSNALRADFKRQAVPTFKAPPLFSLRSRRMARASADLLRYSILGSDSL